MRRFLWPLALLGAVVLTAAAFGGWDRIGPQDDSEERPLVTAVAERRTVENSVVFRGTVSYEDPWDLFSGGSGRVTDVFVAPGAFVEAGDRLVAVNGRPAIAANGMPLAWRPLQEGDSGPDVAALRDYLSAQGFDLEAGDSFEEATSTALRTWQETNGFPPDGVLQPSDLVPGVWPAVVEQVMVQPGMFTSPGQPLARLASPTISVRGQLTPSQRLQISPGLPVELEVTATRLRFDGIVDVVVEETAPDGSPGFVAVILPAEDQAADLVVGVQVQATVVVNRSENAVVAPLAAVKNSGDGTPSVHILDASGQRQLVPIETGLTQGAFVEVLDGLEGGETLVLEGSH